MNKAYVGGSDWICCEGLSAPDPGPTAVARKVCGLLGANVQGCGWPQSLGAMCPGARGPRVLGLWSLSCEVDVAPQGKVWRSAAQNCWDL